MEEQTAKKSKPLKKLDRLVNEAALTIRVNLKRPTPLVKRLYRTRDKMEQLLEKTLEQCGELQDDVEEDPTRSDIPSLCEDFPKYMKRLKKFVAAYNGSCDEDGAPNTVKRVQKQLDQLSKRVSRKQDC